MECGDMLVSVNVGIAALCQARRVLFDAESAAEAAHANFSYFVKTENR